MRNKQACVWATSCEVWDSFLNDPELASAIENARNASSPDEDHGSSAVPESSANELDESDENQHRIGARLRAYETPITDEILRQSIR